MKVLVTGGMGFIGTNLINLLLSNDFEVLNLDKCSYASNKIFHEELASKHVNYKLKLLDLVDYGELKNSLSEFKPQIIFHLAAESHVDNSINSPKEFINSNILGTFHLLEAIRELNFEDIKLVHISTDEVFGSTNSEKFSESTKYDPSSPYSASKAASDHLVSAWNKTYGFNANITNCSNNYGPYQHSEKLIPKIIKCILNNEKIPIYGSGDQIRDWLFVQDHVEALWNVAINGKSGETFNIGTNNELTNLALANKICNLFDVITGSTNSRNLITHVEDRLGHDQRYAIDASKIRKSLNWKPKYNFDDSLKTTLTWYLKYFK